MNRLTKQENGALILDGYDNYTKSLMLHKLGKLEDIEEQLCCPLEVFFRLLKERNYYFEHNGKVYYNEDCYINNIWVDEGFISISVSNKELRSKYIFDVKLFFKDYQKTWFLVKQEMNR